MSGTPLHDDQPARCPFCGANTGIELATSATDATCPDCGCRLRLARELWPLVQRRLAATWGVAPEQIAPELRLIDLLGDGADSLDAVEFVMMFEEFELCASGEGLDGPGADERSQPTAGRFPLPLRPWRLPIHGTHAQTLGDAFRYLAQRKRELRLP